MCHLQVLSRRKLCKEDALHVTNESCNMVCDYHINEEVIKFLLQFNLGRFYLFLMVGNIFRDDKLSKNSVRFSGWNSFSNRSDFASFWSNVSAKSDNPTLFGMSV